MSILATNNQLRRPKWKFAHELVCSRLIGYNVTILAYGQTGSGKTHTMGTTYDGTESDDIGVIPRVVKDIFQQMEEMPDYDFTLNCAFIELYQEKLYDLLSTQPREQSLVDIREVQNNKIAIPNLTEIVVTNVQETTDCLIKGSNDRAVGSTAMNATSSRSHAIFTITLQKVHKENRSLATSAKFHLVDLAGSERSKKTLTTGEQFKEGVKINQGLLALGNVISALGSSSLQHGHIGYRDSKLTRLLQDSLGGNSMTLMIACISPADYNMEETLGTLRYADRARKIKNKPIINQDPKTAEINRLKAEVQTLRVELMSKSGIGTAVVEKCQACDKPPTKLHLQKQMREMAEKLQITLCDIAHRENVISEYEDTIDSLNQKILELKEQIGKLDKIFTSDMSPTEMDAYKEDVRILTDTISNLNSHMTERKECILESSKVSDSPMIMNGTSARTSLADQEDELVQNNEMYIQKQSVYQDELKTIKAELAMKEELHKKLFNNFQQFCLYDPQQNDVSKIHDYEETISKLEKEKKELEDLLRNKNTTVSVKLAEERRKRVNQLETEIGDMRKRNKHQAQLLKQREKDELKVGKLNNEILEMKQMKVKLIRKMKSESEEFRQWRLVREKELTQLRAKDRKMQSDVAKKDMLHEKQRNVLKRKVEEANAAAKRYKEALLKQKIKKAAKPNCGTAGNLNRSASWINDDIEVITSIVDMKQSFDQLVEVRTELNARLRALKRQKPHNQEQIESVQEEIEMRNAQIKDLASKINENDLEVKSKLVYEGIQSLPESRSVIKHLLANVVEQRTNFNQYFAQSRDQKNLLESSYERNHQLQLELKAKMDELREKCNQMEEDHEEKTAVLLKALTTKEAQSEVVVILEERLATKDKEIKELRQMIAAPKLNNKPQRKRHATPPDTTSDIDSDDENVEPDDETVDPDYRGTPLYKRERESKRKTAVSHCKSTSNN